MSSKILTDQNNKIWLMDHKNHLPIEYEGKKYEWMNSRLGEELDRVILKLIEKTVVTHKLFYTEFNGTILLSDLVSLELAYCNCVYPDGYIKYMEKYGG